MTEQEIKELLEECFAKEFPSHVEGQAMNKVYASYAKLKVVGKSQTVDTVKNLYKTARLQLPFGAEIQKAEDMRRLVVTMGGGSNGRNPAIVEMLFTDEKLTLNAWGKEGLIPQSTAKKAIRACLEALDLAD